MCVCVLGSPGSSWSTSEAGLPQNLFIEPAERVLKQVIKKLSFTAKIKLFCRKPSQQNSTLLAGDNHCFNIFQASKDENTSVKLLSYAKKKKKKNQILDLQYFTGYLPNQILCEVRLLMVIHDSDLLFHNFLSLFLLLWLMLLTHSMLCSSCPFPLRYFSSRLFSLLVFFWTSLSPCFQLLQQNVPFLCTFPTVPWQTVCFLIKH